MKHFFLVARAARGEKFPLQTQMSYLVATNACNLGLLGWDLSYLVATNAKILETKDKDKCLTSRNKLGQAK